MDKQDDNDMDMRIADLMLHREQISDEELRQLADDPALLQGCRDWASLERAAAEAPFTDAAEQWERLQNRLAASAPQPQRTRLVMFRVVLPTLLAAAVIVGIIFLPTVIHRSQEAPLPPGMVYRAVAEANPSVSIAVDGEDVRRVPVTPNADSISFAQLDAIDKEVTVTVPEGGAYQVTLRDGTEVWLHPGSELAFPGEFRGSKRVVRLKGEAYFHVTHDSSHPFVVQTDGLETTVLGTQFDIAAYDGQPVAVTLIGGRVSVSNGATNKMLAPGQQARQDGRGMTVQMVDTLSYTSWRDGLLYYDGQTLEQVMVSLGRTYGYSVVFRNERLRRYRIHFVAERSAGIRAVLRNLSQMNHIHATVDGQTITIR